MKFAHLFSALLLAGSLFLAGCNKEDAIVDPANQPPAGVTDERSAIQQSALGDEYSSNSEPTMEDGEMQPASYESSGGISSEIGVEIDAAIRPLRFGRFIHRVVRNVEVEFESGDSVAEAKVTKDIYGVFKVRGISGEGDTVTVEKEFHDRSMKRVIFRRIARDPVRFWRNWVPVATSLVVGGTVEPNDNIVIVKSELFLPNGDTVVVTDPLEHFLRYRWVRLLDSLLHPDRPPVPELEAEQQLTMRVTLVSASPDTDLIALRFASDAFRKHRLRMRLVSEEDNGDGTFTRVYDRMWTVPAVRGHFHVAIDAMTHGTLFDDAEPYSACWWGVPYRVF